MTRKSNHPPLVLHAFHNVNVSSGTVFLRPGQQVPFTSTFGWGMWDTGSIVMLSCSCAISGHSNDDTFQMHARIGNSNVFTATSPTIVVGDVGTVVYFNAKQGVDVDRFVEGDFLSLVITVSAATATVGPDMLCLVGLEMDT